MALGSGPGMKCGHSDCIELGMGCQMQPTFRNTPPEMEPQVDLLDDFIKQRLEEIEKTPRLNKIVHNKCVEFFEVLKKNHQKEHEMLVFLGTPIIESSIVPDGEIWCFDQFGKILQKFKYTTPKL